MNVNIVMLEIELDVSGISKRIKKTAVRVKKKAVIDVLKARYAEENIDVITGLLINSHDVKKVDNDTIEISNSAPYANFVDKGTVKMDARPWLSSKKTAEAVKDAFIKALLS